MTKKQVVLGISIMIFLLLVGCTIASFRIYDRSLPRVSTFYYRTDTAGEDWIIAHYLPQDSITFNQRGETVTYRLRRRMGWFSEEFYVEEIPLDYYYDDNREKVYRSDGYVRVVVASLEEGDQLVKNPSNELRNGLTVKWVSGERGQFDADVWG